MKELRKKVKSYLQLEKKIVEVIKGRKHKKKSIDHVHLTLVYNDIANKKK